VTFSLTRGSQWIGNRGIADILAGEKCAASIRSMGMHTHTAHSTLCVEPSAVDPPEI
jgi:hypothetical protein